MLYCSLVEQHNNNEEARDVLARKPLSDYFYSAEKETVTKSGEMVGFGDEMNDQR